MIDDPRFVLVETGHRAWQSANLAERRQVREFL
jgi:hypothetical protein